MHICNIYYLYDDIILADMLDKDRLKGQMNFFQPTLKEQLNLQQVLYLLSERIDGSSLESDLSKYCINP